MHARLLSTTTWVCECVCVFGFLWHKHDYKIYKSFAQHESNAKKQNTSLRHSHLEQKVWGMRCGAVGGGGSCISSPAPYDSVHRTHGRMRVCRHRVRWMRYKTKHEMCSPAPNTLRMQRRRRRRQRQRRWRCCVGRSHSQSLSFSGLARAFCVRAFFYSSFRRYRLEIFHSRECRRKLNYHCARWVEGLGWDRYRKKTPTASDGDKITAQKQSDGGC